MAKSMTQCIRPQLGNGLTGLRRSGQYLFILLTLLPTLALAYPIQISPVSPSKNIVLKGYDLGSYTALEITNRGPQATRCKAVFNNGPEQPRVRVGTIEPGQSLQLTAPVLREVTLMKVTVECTH